MNTAIRLVLAAVLSAAAPMLLIPRTSSALQTPSQQEPATGPGSPASSEDLTFEVASIRPASLSPETVIGPTLRANGFTGNYMTIKSYIQFAYAIPNWDWIVGPTWLNNDSPAYTITAKASSAVPERTIRIMLRHLLAERFELKTHTEFRDQAVYALVVGKGRPKLQPVQYEEADADICARPLTTGMEAHHCSMEAFANVLSGAFSLGRPVVNQTGLTGRYDFALRYATRRGFAPLLEATDDVPGPTIFDAIQDVGLKLEPRKAPVEVLVVDHVNRTPTEN